MFNKRFWLRVLHRDPYGGRNIIDGLHSHGYQDFSEKNINLAGPNDLLILWNRYQRNESDAQAIERAGGKVVVLENGLLGRNFDDSVNHYSISVHQHNGLGENALPNMNRWERKFERKIATHEWKNNHGGDIIFLSTRHMGSDICKEPKGWRDEIAILAREKFPNNRFRIRNHPGAQANLSQTELEKDLSNCKAAITWGSSAGIKSILFGIPVFYGLTGWVGSCAATHISKMGERIFTGSRDQLKAKVASFIVDEYEIKSGEAFDWILHK